MKQINLNNILLFGMMTLILMLTACSSEEEERMESFTVSVPIEIVTTQPQFTTRTAGDPGLDDELKVPAHVYIWIWLKNADDTYSTKFVELHPEAGDWNTSGDGVYIYNKELKYTFSTLVERKNPIEGVVYAVASEKAIDNVATIVANGTNHTADDFGTFPNWELNVIGWTPEQLRDLYSTPDSKVTGSNKEQTMAVDGAKIRFSNVKLYHCAAKVDFQWEVQEAKRNTTWVNSITVTGLPTSCKLFKPTQNTNAGGTATITANDGNKWTGREYTYVLQPENGTITYNVDLEGKTDVSGATFTPSKVDETFTAFTGWYRIRATVNN